VLRFGNPLRASIIEGTNQERINQKSSVQESVKNSHNILVVGGSLGAQVLNQTVPDSFAKLKAINHNKENLPFNIWHQTGKGKQQGVIDAYNQHTINQQNLTDEQVRVTEFIDDIASAYQWADVVICRAGALTVSELAMAATPAIFIPLPHAVDDHQTKNAQYLVVRGGATLIKQKDLTSDVLAKLLNELFSEPQILKNMKQATFAAADGDATNKVAELCQQVAA